MRDRTTIVGKLEILERMNNSYFGNPRYLVSIGGTECRTAVDANLAYGITNYRDKPVKAVIGFHYNKLTIESVEEFNDGSI